MAQDTPRSAELAQLLRTGPFHLALRSALTERGLALTRVQHKLAQRGVTIGVTSLSYWQQGARRPQRPESLRAVRALEEVLDLPARSLHRLLVPEGGARPEAERPPARSYRSPAAPATTVRRLFDELDAPVDGGLHTVGHHERVRIGPERRLLARESLHVVRAHRDGVDRFVAVHRGDAGCDPSRVRVRAAENCRLGRVRGNAEAGVVIAELLFDARLRAGDTHVFGYGFEDGSGGPSTEYQRGFGVAGGQYVLQVRFDEAALPVRCTRFAQVAAGAPRSGRQELPLSEHHRAVHLVEQGVRPGILGIAWDWE
ncbi:hypothetical protein AB0G60_29215 [Streptomyces angustmyceticus]|uniref:XRE family transcriptional regulator n=1 Tax=Streptomyces angustmyceticus TaxID=285578 RepID=A0A5J4LM36_9ACTN|nr:hypothetical protein [Streptomyces angustmyceticus]UAL69783.1 hypothetical protein K7396_27195 [Streptomyces angustmyceticus]GES32650.1 hypothetical protein San01_51380 [Streptomyces angustmyceticus]